jgi:hypothetical protein
VPRPSIRRLVALVAVGAATLVASACGDDSNGQNRSSRESDVYAAILIAVAADEPPADATPILYVAPLANEKAIPLQVQVSVVNALASDATVRFVDDADQAIDQEADGAPVLNDALLVRLGAVPPDGASVRVPGELYRTETDTSPVVYDVSETANGWVVKTATTQTAAAS